MCSSRARLGGHLELAAGALLPAAHPAPARARPRRRGDDARVRTDGRAADAARDSARGRRAAARRCRGGQGPRDGRSPARAQGVRQASRLRSRALARVTRAPAGRPLTRHSLRVRVRLRARAHPARAGKPRRDARRRPRRDPAGSSRRLGARSRKVRRYPGLKEEYYLHGFEPDESVLASLGVDRGRIVVVVRTPPDVSLYHRHGNQLFEEVLEQARTRRLGARGRPAAYRGAATRDHAARCRPSSCPARGRRAEPRRTRRSRRLGRGGR